MPEEDCEQVSLFDNVLDSAVNIFNDHENRLIQLPMHIGNYGAGCLAARRRIIDQNRLARYMQVNSFLRPPNVPSNCYFKRFSPSGKFMVAIDLNERLLLFPTKYTGCSSWDMTTEKYGDYDEEDFGSHFFGVPREIDLVSGSSRLRVCRDFCLISEDENYMMMAASCPSSNGPDKPAKFMHSGVEMQFPLKGEMSIRDDFVLYLIDLRSGQRCDQVHFSNDYGYVARQFGISYWGDEVGVVLMASQRIQRLRIDRGMRRFVVVVDGSIDLLDLHNALMIYLVKSHDNEGTKGRLRGLVESLVLWQAQQINSTCWLVRLAPGSLLTCANFRNQDCSVPLGEPVISPMVNSYFGVVEVLEGDGGTLRVRDFWNNADDEANRRHFGIEINNGSTSVDWRRASNTLPIPPQTRIKVPWLLAQFPSKLNQEHWILQTTPQPASILPPNLSDALFELLDNPNIDLSTLPAYNNMNSRVNVRYCWFNVLVNPSLPLIVIGYYGLMEGPMEAVVFHQTQMLKR